MRLNRSALSFVATLLAFVVLLGSLIVLDGRDSKWREPSATPVTRVDRPAGGDISVGVATPPEFGDEGSGGQTLKSLTLPSLFTAQPNGRWTASLVEPGTDRTARDGRSATFRLRDVKWSNGEPITVDDLRRTADDRFVEAIESNGSRIKVVFNAPLPGWRFLWSSIEAPEPQLTAGPFEVETIISGKETVLVRNPDWFEEQRANLERLRLRVVPDPATAQRFLASGEIDVWKPKADTDRVKAFESIASVDVATSSKGGRWAALVFNSATVNEAVRQSVIAKFPRQQFVSTVLQGEADLWDGLGAGIVTSNRSATVADRFAVVLSPEEPTALEVQRVFSRVGQENNLQIDPDIRSESVVWTGFERNEYDAMFLTGQKLPTDCWTCVYGVFDADTARKADGGDRDAQDETERRISERSLMLPLWQERSVVAYRADRIKGIEANGFSASSAFGAQFWWVDR